MRPSGQSFWRFSLRVYRAPGVQAACLALQERCNADVNLLLFCGWNGRQRRELDPQRLRSAIGRVALWQSQVIVPVRTARRALKCADDPVAAALAQPLRRRLAAIELELERVEQQLLAELAAAWPPSSAAAPAATAAANLSRYLAWLAPAAARQDLADLACIAQASSRGRAPGARHARNAACAVLT